MKSKKSLDTRTLIAFGLASLLPSFACADESIEKIKEVFDSQDRDSQKVKKLDSYSPVADLRSSSLGRDGTENLVNGNDLFKPSDLNNPAPVVINQDTTIGSTANDMDRWNVTTNNQATKASRNITIENNATLNINAHNFGNWGYRFAISGGVANLNMPNILWQGGTININFKMGTGGYGGFNHNRGALTAEANSSFTITSNLNFHYIEEINATKTLDELFRSSVVSVIAAVNGGAFKLLGDKTTISINQFDKDENGKSTDKRNRGLGGFALNMVDRGTIYLNAKDDGTINNKTATVQVTGGISTFSLDQFFNAYKGGKIYAHFTGSDSFLKGNVYVGRYDSADNFSTLKMSFTGGAKMDGSIVFIGDAKESNSDILFASGSSLNGKILDLRKGNHKVTFDGASFTGSIIRDDSQSVLDSVGYISSVVDERDQIIKATNDTSNTIITFKNTAGHIFGDGTNDIVDASYNGQIIGDFDMTDTMIRGGNGGKGFKGSGKNTLTFDFANSASTSGSTDRNFTISGGGKGSVYNLDRFTTEGQRELDLTALTSSNHLYSKIEKAGINIAAEVKDGNSGHLNGILQFRKTNIKVGEGANALFADKTNILGGTNDLNGLALGASFGNAIWNDINDDGKVGVDEIKASGVNYRLTSDQATPSSGDTNSSTGNIGTDGDNVKKAINFIFTDGTYKFNGETQGYTGTIKGGTNDSQYAFVNAGFITQNQVGASQGALVLFNTAFRGDLGVKNKAESIVLDFSDGQTGLFDSSGLSNGNIVGSGNKDIVFNFTGNTKAEKYTGAVVGDSAQNKPEETTAKFTMLNLKTYSSDGNLSGTGALGVKTSDPDKSIDQALKNAGLTNFNNKSGNGIDKIYTDGTTNIDQLSTSKTTIALRGTSLDTSNMNFKNYVYDFAFGSGFAPFDGIAVEDSTLSGVIDLTKSNQANNNAGHRFEFRGNALKDGETSGVVASDDKIASLLFDDSDATYTKTPTFKIGGLTENSKITNSTIKFSKTNLEGDLHTGENVAVDLNFTNGRTWKMSESSITLNSGSGVNDQGKIIIHGDMKAQGVSQIPSLKVDINYKGGQDKYRTIDMVNTGATLKLGFGNNSVDWGDHSLQAFNLRGTSLEVTTQRNTKDKFQLQGVVWDDIAYEKRNFNLVFAKGGKLETTKTDASGQALSITNKDTGEGNYIAESVANFDGFNTKSGFNMTLIGEDSFNERLFGGAGSVYQDNSKLDLVNVVDKLTATHIKTFFQKGDKGETTITLQGTDLKGAGDFNGIGNNGKLTFNMTFIKDGTNDGYVDIKKYGELATTNANGALKDEILKVAESKMTLSGKLDFASANYNIRFIGADSQNLNETNIIAGGSANSTITFRNANLNAGNDANSSLQGIKGKVIFDLTHKNEESTITRTLGNMFAENGAFETQLKASDDSVLKVNKLVFSDGTNAPNLAEIGSYFKDADVFGTLSTKDYSNIAKIDTTKSSKLSFGAGTIKLNGANQELVFIGTASHKFGETSNQTILGISTGSTLTFIDAGELKVANIQDGQGTINLVGSSKIELQNNKLTLGDDKGANLTINARFDGKNTLGDGVAVNGVTTGKGSNVDIGGKTEKTTYHLLFDYTDALGNKTNQGFGEYKMYQGNIVGLTDQSVIKFKNAGYIDGDQIAGTNARILVDNTQIKGDFRGDNGTLDYRKGKISVIGNILTSDAKASGAVLSRKELTFDFTGSSTKLSGLNDTAIQAGYKIATDYQGAGNSSLTFQNAPVLSLGNDTEGSNESTFIKAIANDIGFNIKDAKAIADGFNDATNNKASYILSGTELGFQGTTITTTDANKSITENLYSLNLSFDQRNEGRETNSLGSTIAKSSLTASSIKMGNAQTSSSANASDKKPLNLSLTFHDKGSLVGGNTKNLGDTLEVQLKNGAKFELEADSSNGKIGTLILSENIDGGAASNPFELAENSRLSIGAGSMSFVGNFAQKDDGKASTKAGDIKAHFNGTNQAYGSIAGRGDMSVTIEGNALLSATQVSGVSGITPNTTADLIINTSNATKSDVTLAHTKGTAQVISGAYDGLANGNMLNYTSLNLTKAQSHTILEGAFAIQSNNMKFEADSNKTLKLSGHTFLKAENGTSITLKNVGNVNSDPKTLAINAIGDSENFGVNLTLINFDPSLTVKLTNLTGAIDDKDWGNQGTWNIRGVNINLDYAFWSENNDNLKKFVFAKGAGTETDKGKLSELTTEDRINESTLSGEMSKIGAGSHTKTVGMRNGGQFTFIGKQALTMSETRQLIDGLDGGKITFGFYNALLKSGSLILDNTNAGSRKNSAFYDEYTLSGTDAFNLSITNQNGATGTNEAKIDAVFVKDSGITGDYISTTKLNEALTKTLEAYKTTKAGGALTNTELKTLQSKAYGNITMADTVTATMKFIGNDSHSFDGSVAVDGIGTSAKFYRFKETDSTKLGDTFNGTKANWQKLGFNDDGSVKIIEANTPSSDLAVANLATLSGGNADSRFDFDHTRVRLDLIKNAGGKTYVYNSTILGKINVDTAPTESSTTLFFNDGNIASLGDDSKKYIEHHYTNSGINLDLKTAHRMREENLENTKLGQTSKDTHIVLIGQDAYKQTAGDKGLDLSFLPQEASSEKYSFTIIKGGVIDANQLNATNSENIKDPSDVVVNEMTIFGKSKVTLVETTLYGPRNFAEVGFIDTGKNDIRESSWGGGNAIDQFLIFDFHEGAGNIGNRKASAIKNTSGNSRYIFTNIFKKNTAKEDRTLTLKNGGLKGAINTQLKTVGSADGEDTINSAVKGTLGLRGVSVKGDIDENTNGVDIVFNSTDNISYIDDFEGTEHKSRIDTKIGKNYIANSNGTDDEINGYATLAPISGNGSVTISGGASKNIVFIGDKAVKNGFDKLKIQDGTQKSNYTFYSVGTLNDTFLKNVGLQRESEGLTATAGNFTFEASTITGNINVNADPTNKLTFKNVIYSGKLSGNLEKELSFAQGSKNITINGGSDKSVYDFSNVASIDGLNIDLTRKGNQANYYASEIKGFGGNTSLSGSLKLAKSANDVIQDPSQGLYSNSFTFKDNAKWTVTGQSRVMNLALANNGNSYNLEIDPLANQTRMRNASDSTKTTPMLEVRNLSSTNGRALIHTVIDTQNQSNSQVGTIKADSFSGTLYITAKDTNLKKGDFKTDGNNAIVLVEAGRADGGEVRGNTIKKGLRYSITALEHQARFGADDEWKKVEENQSLGSEYNQRWVLASFKMQENKELVDETSSVISNPYRMLLIETNNLNKRMGELRDNDYAQGAWIRVFNGMDSGEGTKNLYTNVQLGYDYAFGVIGAKNYTGGAFSTSVTDITGDQYSGKGNTYSIALYNSYIADNGLYVDAIAKYLYMDQRLTPRGQGESKVGNHAYSLGAEVGYRVPIAETNFYVETQGEIVGGIIQGMKNAKLGIYEGSTAWGDLETTPSLSLRAGIVAGYTLKTQSGFRADFRVGTSLVSEFAKGGSIVLKDDLDTPIHSSIKNDNKVVLNLGTNLILTDKWRIYIDAERSFGGSRNTDYQASVGARFSFGEVVKSLPKDEITPLKLKSDEDKSEEAKSDKAQKTEQKKDEKKGEAKK